MTVPDNVPAAAATATATATEAETISRLRISLNCLRPKIWRTVEVPVGFELAMVHRVIQAAMGWNNWHAYVFRIGRQTHGDLDFMEREDYPERQSSGKHEKLAVLIAQGHRKLDYTYDLGDNWDHTVEIEAVFPADPSVTYPRYLKGRMRCLLEDPSESDPSEHSDPEDLDEAECARRVAQIAESRLAERSTPGRALSPPLVMPLEHHFMTPAGGSGDEDIARVRIVLNDTQPAIWRTVDFPVTCNLKMLHDVIQFAMGWNNCHLWEFRAGDRRYGLPDPDYDDDTLAWAKNVKLAVILNRGVQEMGYKYDMGDGWEHTITVEFIRPAEVAVKYPRFVAGQGRCPPEDCGGPYGFRTFLEALADPAHEEHETYKDWYKRTATSRQPGEYDRHDINERFATYAVASIATRRHRGLAAYAKRQANRFSAGRRSASPE
ncbi:hypothetical protein HKX48_002643 [Thoreauomyces humboldtii]|nr:hypothetical protein HKX48_002643 [Thoreauomyces humboldtii]